MQKYLFLLWREPALSLAELRSIFSSVEQKWPFAYVQDEEWTIDLYKKWLGWTIKIAKILVEWVKKAELLDLAVSVIEKKVVPEKKLRIGIDCFVPSLNSLVFKVKDGLRKKWNSIRVVQHDNGRIKNATTLHEKLIEQGIELIVFADGLGYVIAETVWIQDIESYSDRDMNRDRSMTVGMMPPKIAQIMINLWTQGDYNCIVWDAFCGLGTTLIEALHAGHAQLRGSDLENAMIVATQKNIEKQPNYDPKKVKIFPLDATKIDTYKLDSSAIVVTEWMLGKNFTQSTLTREAALQERKKITQLYQGFLDAGYQNSDVKKMVFCLPFWNIWKEIIYMPEIHQLSQSWKVDPLCVSGKRYLIHARPGQSVGREIVIVKK